MTLTQKESTLLKDLISHEQLCIEKYGRYTSEANDPQLKNLFTQLAAVERTHLDSLNQLAGGTVPDMSGGKSQKPPSSFNPVYVSKTNEPAAQRDKYLCSDLLSTEKHVSGLYDTCLFEFRDAAVRDVLNHIQKEEQEHGLSIYSYMAANNLY